jgi:hypothetical protein
MLGEKLQPLLPQLAALQREPVDDQLQQDRPHLELKQRNRFRMSGPLGSGCTMPSMRLARDC